ncbi:MAG TPA: hypothetical protein DIW47_02880 [Bacteroidetes bacterium]|nr:hypothetical protein [Bacteroidota bacterium]
MFHRSRIKFGSITNLTDARYAAAVYADWLGFCFIPGHSRYIEPIKAKEIIDWLSGPKMVAELGSLMPETMMSALEILMIDTVQVNDLDAAKAWKEAGFEVIYEGPESADIDGLRVCLPAESTDPAHEIIDLSSLSMEEIEKNWLDPAPYGIQLIGGDESIPGICDFARIDEVLEHYEL